jgi:hypothetical protein
MPTYKPSLRDLEILGECWPIIFGSANNWRDPLSQPLPGGVKRAQGPLWGYVRAAPVHFYTGGRPEHVDEKSDKGHLWRALCALSSLQSYAARGPEEKKTATILLYYHGVCGQVARSGDGHYVRIAEFFTGEELGPEPVKAWKKKNGTPAGHAAEISRDLWRQWTLRRATLAVRGIALYREACERWLGASVEMAAE